MMESFLCIVSLSRVIDSIARWANVKTVPPGVSYTPLDLIPINLFSTRSTLPIPFFPATSFNFLNSFAGDSFLLFKATGSPFLYSNKIEVDLFGAFVGEVVLWKINSGAGLLGSSNTFPSVEVWYRLSSTEKGGAPFYLVVQVYYFF